jgi:site-specific recombinase XerD
MYLTKEKSSPFYQLVYFHKGKRTKKTTKSRTKAEALRFLTEFKNILKEREKQKIVSLSEFESEYTSLIAPIRTPAYLRSIEISFRRLRAETGDILLLEIDQKKAEKFISNVYRDSKYAAACYYRTLKAAFEKAREWNYISENPFKKFKTPKVPHTLPAYLTYRELQLIIKATGRDIIRDLFLSAYYTGLRAGELLNLRWNAVDFKNLIITVENTETFTTKSKRERIVPINRPLLNILKNRLPKIMDINKTDYIFSKSRGIPFNVDFISKQFKKAVRKAKLSESYHLHSLRHSFASNLVQSGVSLYVVKELLGHRDISTTQIYSHIRKENLSEAVKLLEPRQYKRAGTN